MGPGKGGDLEGLGEDLGVDWRRPRVGAGLGEKLGEALGRSWMRGKMLEGLAKGGLGFGAGVG